MFHVEVRQFPHQARAFNLTEERLRREVLAPWLAGAELAIEDRSFSPRKARLTIYEAPELAPGEMGLGRGWASVTRSGEDVTARMLAQGGAGGSSELEGFKRRVVERCAAGAVPIRELMTLAGELHPDWRPSERLGLCEQAVWELLHQRALRMLSSAGTVDTDQWQGVVLGWASWTGQGPWEPLLEAI